MGEPGTFQPPDLSRLCLAITEHAPLPMATVEGPSHIVRYANPAFCRLMDKPREEFVGKPFAEVMPEKGDCLSERCLPERAFRSIPLSIPVWRKSHWIRRSSNRSSITISRMR